MTICGSCRRRTDPNRSFCSSCGSSVFIDSNDPSSVPHFDPAPTSLTNDDTHRPVSKPRRPRREVVRKISEATKKNATASAARAGAGCITGLIRFAIFVAVIYYGGRWLLNLPEVAALTEAIKQNEVSDETVQATFNGLKQRVERLFGGTSDASDAPPEPVQTETDVSRPATEPGQSVALAPAVDTPPEGVYLPGNGVTTPRVLRRVNPVYPTRARQARIQGPVVLRGVVQIDGEITDVTVLQSPGAEYGLDAAAVGAVEQWRFEPGKRGNETVPVMIRVTINFTLQPPAPSTLVPIP